MAHSREVEYYKRRVDELAAQSLKYDYEISGLRHAIRQKERGFALLSALQQSIGGHKGISSVFEAAIGPITSILAMDRTIVLVPTEQENTYRPSLWVGVREQAAERLASLAIEFPAEFAQGTGVLVVNSLTQPTPLIDRLQMEFELPYFVCLPVIAEGLPIGLILSGRLTETRPLYPPFDQGDVDTFQAIAGLISASVENMRIAVLQETDRLKTEFFANISHEFRTPITLTLGPLEQILAGGHGDVPPPLREQLEIIVRNQERLLGLINQILDLAKLEAGEMELRCVSTPHVNDLVHSWASPFRLLAEKRGLDLRLDLDASLGGADLFVDGDKFQRVVSNLLSNAVKFTREGWIEVRTERHERRFRLTVTDTGVGIDPDELPYVFDRFRQADSRGAREHAGTGIGLALVKEIAALHGGDVAARSELGKGSTFVVSVPLGQAHLSPASIVEAADDHLERLHEQEALVVLEGGMEQADVAEHNRAAEESRDATRRTLLYAEDNRDLRNYVSGLLAEDYNVFLASDGEEALDLVRRYRPDLILADQMMPCMSGTDLLRAIRADERLSAIPVLFLTARAGSAARIETLEAGADDYLAKPFVEAELRARIRNLLRAGEQERKLAELNRELESWNLVLEQRVAEQVAEMERLERLRRFFSPQLAEMIVAGDTDDPLETHRREITVVFLDLRGFTAFAETAQPEEVMNVLREYHAEMGGVVLAYEGTLERFTGDGMMVFFNDPIPIADAPIRAIRMALEMRERATRLREKWHRLAYELDVGIGIAQGYATIGRIGFEGRIDYGAVGAVTNLAARLCAEAKAGQILIPQRVLAAVEELVEVEPLGKLELKGFHRPVVMYDVIGEAAGRMLAAAPKNR
jgi:signal transduction histidine kinase/class 3 adenylate cyclase/CheY-like chemotaxis protein